MVDSLRGCEFDNIQAKSQTGTAAAQPVGCRAADSSQFKPQCVCGRCAGTLPVNLQSNAELPLSKAVEPQTLKYRALMNWQLFH